MLGVNLVASSTQISSCRRAFGNWYSDRVPKVSSVQNGAKVAFKQEHDCARAVVGIHWRHINCAVVTIVKVIALVPVVNEPHWVALVWLQCHLKTRLVPTLAQLAQHRCVNCTRSIPLVQVQCQTCATIVPVTLANNRWCLGPMMETSHRCDLQCVGTR